MIIPLVCTAVWNLMVDTYMHPPAEADWNRIEYGFRTHWNFPNCCGAIDGKHVAFRSPPNSGSLYFNYKNHFSVVLMALVNLSMWMLVIMEVTLTVESSRTHILVNVSCKDY